MKFYTHFNKFINDNILLSIVENTVLYKAQKSVFLIHTNILEIK